MWFDQFHLTRVKIESMHFQKFCGPIVCIFQTKFNEALLTTKKRAIREKPSSKKIILYRNNLMADKSVFPLFLFVSLFLLKENLCLKNTKVCLINCRPTVFEIHIRPIYLYLIFEISSSRTWFLNLIFELDFGTWFFVHFKLDIYCL